MTNDARIAAMENEVLAAWVSLQRESIRNHDTHEARVELDGALGVYADSLIQIGDVRGELIARDLPNLKGPHADLEVCWLGVIATYRDCISIKFGLIGLSIDARSSSLLRELCDSPAGRFIEQVTLHGSSSFLETNLVQLCRDDRPWMGKLKLVATGESKRVSSDLMAEFVERTPNLHTMELSSNGPLLEAPHPTALRIAVDGIYTLDSIRKPVGQRSGVIELDLAFESGLSQAGRRGRYPVRRGFLSVEKFPELVKLNLERNEPGYLQSRNLGGACDAYELVRSAEILPQLTHLRMPSLRRATQAEAVDRLLINMRNLVEMRIVRSHVKLSWHDRRVIVSAMNPWPSRDEIDHAAAVFFRVETEVSGYAVVRELANVLNDLPSEVVNEAWDAWAELWCAIDTAINVGRAEVERGVVAKTIGQASRRVIDDGWRSVVQLLQAPVSNSQGQSLFEIISSSNDGVLE